MTPEEEMKLWTRAVAYYDQSIKDTFAAIPGIIEKFQLPEAYIDWQIEQYDDRNWVKTAWMRVQREVCKGIIADLRPLKLQTRLEMEKFFGEDRQLYIYNFSQSFIEDHPDVETESDILHAAILCGAHHVLHDVIDQIGGLMDEMVYKKDPTSRSTHSYSDRTDQMGAIVGNLHNAAIVVNGRHIQEILDAWDRCGDVAMLCKAFQGWEANMRKLGHFRASKMKRYQAAAKKAALAPA